MDQTAQIFAAILGGTTLLWGLFELISGQAYTRTMLNMYSGGDPWVSRDHQPGRYWVCVCLHLACGVIVCGIALAFYLGWIQ